MVTRMNRLAHTLRSNGGAVANAYCESSARDAVERGYRVVMLADACAGHARGPHEASLNTFYRSFSDAYRGGATSTGASLRLGAVRGIVTRLFRK